MNSTLFLSNSIETPPARLFDTCSRRLLTAFQSSPTPSTVTPSPAAPLRASS
jgi:hypothetical protein